MWESSVQRTKRTNSLDVGIVGVRESSSAACIATAIAIAIATATCIVFPLVVIPNFRLTITLAAAHRRPHQLLCGGLHTNS
jgi:cytochrome bd-type quinol oxidase subunit 2